MNAEAAEAAPNLLELLPTPPADLAELGPYVAQLWGMVPDFVAVPIVATIIFGIAAVVAQAATVFMVLMERKVLAWFTFRKGPNRVGPWGVLQTIADGVKLLFKEDIMGPQQDRFLFTLAPAIFLLPAFAIYALVPFSEGLVGINLPVSLLLIFAISSISVIGLLVAGWASNNKYSLLGGLRSAAQAISYEIPLILSLLGVVLFTGSMDLQQVVSAQSGGLLDWYSIKLLPFSFLIFFIASIAEVNRVPFDLPEAESELVSGYNTEYSGMKFAMFFLAEYASLFIFSALTAVVFFGGYYSPFGGLLTQNLGLDTAFANALQLPQAGELLRQVEMLSWMLLKTYTFVYIAMLLRGTLPRLKPDQLMGFSWKFLIPMALINVFMLAFYKFVDFNNLTNTWGYLAAAVIVLVTGFGGYSKFISSHFQNSLRRRLAH